MTTETVQAPAKRPSLLTDMRVSEDWWAIWCAGFILLVSFLAVVMNAPADLAEKVNAQEEVKVVSPLKSRLGSPGKWTNSPIDAFFKPAKDGGKPTNVIPAILGVFVTIAILFTLAIQIQGKSGSSFLFAFPFVFLLATLAYTLSGQSVIKAYNLEYALWALMVGLIISNTIGTPKFIKPAALTEFYI